LALRLSKVGLANGVSVGVGFGEETVTGLPQTNFFPLFTQVYFFVPTTWTLPSGLQTAPTFGTGAGLGAAPELIGPIENAISVASTRPSSLFNLSPDFEIQTTGIRR
jgi:hypothetical protein